MSNYVYTNDDLEFEYDAKFYKIDVEAHATYEYDPGCMYMRNGDPGYPPESSFDIDSVDSTWYLINEDDSLTKVEATKEMKAALQEYLDNNSDWFEPEED